MLVIAIALSLMISLIQHEDFIAAEETENTLPAKN